MDEKVARLVATVKVAIPLLPLNTTEGKDIASRLELAIDELIRNEAKNDYIRSNAERGISGRI